jgi:hypothetical protein
MPCALLFPFADPLTQGGAARKRGAILHYSKLGFALNTLAYIAKAQ